MSIEVSITDNSDLVKAAVKEQIIVGLTAVGQQAEGNVILELRKPKKHADGTTRPTIDTGRLINSITNVVKENEQAVYVGTNVEYGPYVIRNRLKWVHQKHRLIPILNPAS